MVIVTDFMLSVYIVDVTRTMASSSAVAIAGIVSGSTDAKTSSPLLILATLAVIIGVAIASAPAPRASLPLFVMLAPLSPSGCFRASR